MAKKNDFLHFPALHFCTTIFSMGPPFSGKTWLLLQCLKYWLQVGMFEKYVLILPQFKKEMEGSYDFLNAKEYEDYVDIYESFDDTSCNKIITQQTVNRDAFKAGKLKEMPRVFFCIDDATSQGKNMFKSQVLTKFATENRHLFIHSWFLMHYDKGIMHPKVRNNMLWVILYPMKSSLLKKAYEDYVDYPDFDTYEEFKEYFTEHCTQVEHGVLVMQMRKKYNAGANKWFSNE